MVESKENYKFHLRVKGLTLKFFIAEEISNVPSMKYNSKMSSFQMKKNPNIFFTKSITKFNFEVHFK